MEQFKGYPDQLSTVCTVKQSDHVDVRVLAAGVAEAHPVPSGANYVAFSSTDEVWVKMDGVAAVPDDDIEDGSASELNPTPRYINGVSSIGLIAPRACIVQMAFYS